MYLIYLFLFICSYSVVKCVYELVIRGLLEISCRSSNKKVNDLELISRIELFSNNSDYPKYLGHRLYKETFILLLDSVIFSFPSIHWLRSRYI